MLLRKESADTEDTLTTERDKDDRILRVVYQLNDIEKLEMARVLTTFEAAGYNLDSLELKDVAPADLQKLTDSQRAVVDKVQRLFNETKGG